MLRQRNIAGAVMFDLETVNRDVKPIFVNRPDDTGDSPASIVLLAYDIPTAQFRGWAKRPIGKVKHIKPLQSPRYLDSISEHILIGIKQHLTDLQGGAYVLPPIHSELL